MSKTIAQRKERLLASLSQFGLKDIAHLNPVLCVPFGHDLSQWGFERVDWAPYIWIGKEPLPKDHEYFVENKVFAIGLASVIACLQLDVKIGDKILDMCAAPGIKSLYLQILHQNKLNLYVNDISHDRLFRLRKVFQAFQVPLPHFTQQPGQTLLQKYSTGFFDAVIIDAPCSGEGNILTGDDAALANWSPAKVKRLAQLQRKLLITGKQLLKQHGEYVYATCTLNLHENEKALLKAGFELKQVDQETIRFIKLEKKAAVRIVPTAESIGFFVAKL
jgi:16S rRNA C967 or C1407 C5-methylase (RsmB/RsmF family)